MSVANSPFTALSVCLQRLLTGHHVAAGGLFSVTLPLAVPVPEQRLFSAPALCAWQRPGQGEAVVGLGALHRRVLAAELGADDTRFTTLSRDFQALVSHWQHQDPEGCGLLPVVFVGHAFDPADPMEGPWSGLPNAQLLVPQVSIRLWRGSWWATFSAPDWRERGAAAQVGAWMELLGQWLSAPESCSALGESPRRVAVEPDDRQWLARVEQALGEIRAGHLDKVVASRRVAIATPSTPCAERLLNALAGHHGEGTLFATRFGEQVLVAATPERLVRLDGDGVFSEAVGGTIARGGDPDADRVLAQRLLQDAKSANEHRLVVHALQQALAPLCDGLQQAPQPEVITLRHLQHLRTPLWGTPREGISLLDFAARLHPSPAVGGWPLSAARNWLRGHGEDRRGWYTGTAGWLDLNGHGELSVLLRCALLGPGRADLYAGAGIVAGSHPAAELAETELKLNTMLEAFSAA